MSKQKSIHCKILKKNVFIVLKCCHILLHKTEIRGICEKRYSFQELNHEFQDVLNCINIKN